MLELKKINKKKIKILGIGGGKVLFSEMNLVPITLVLYKVPIIEKIHLLYSNIDNSKFSEILINEISNLNWKREIKVIMTENIFLAGLSLIDLDLISQKLSIPIISVFRKKPEGESIQKSIEKIKNTKYKIYLKEAVEKYTDVVFHQSSGCYFISKLIDERSASFVLSNNILQGKIPEPVRVASLFSKSI